MVGIGVGGTVGIGVGGTMHRPPNRSHIKPEQQFPVQKQGSPSPPQGTRVGVGISVGVGVDVGVGEGGLVGIGIQRPITGLQNSPGQQSALLPQGKIGTHGVGVGISVGVGIGVDVGGITGVFVGVGVGLLATHSLLNLSQDSPSQQGAEAGQNSPNPRQGWVGNAQLEEHTQTSSDWQHGLNPTIQ